MSPSRALSLAAYRVLTWTGASGSGDAGPPRPEGELLWIHVGTRSRLAPLNDLCDRLLSQRPGLSLLLTGPAAANPRQWDDAIQPVIPLPGDGIAAARNFVEHWKPDMGLWCGGSLLPNLIVQAADSGIPMVLLEADADMLMPRKRRWMPDLSRHVLDSFRSILTTSEDKARQIRRLGVPFAKVAIAAPLRISPNPGPWPEDELIETNHALAGRPVWLAAWVQDKEFISVLSAHRYALRLLHRLVLVLHVADVSEAAPLRKRLQAMDLRCADWNAGDPIEDTTQVVLTSDPENLGLWYRVSPLTFLGSSLEFGARGQNPLDAAALGSAILHGPHVRDYTDIYARLTNAKASRAVRTAEELGRYVVELLAPDQAADMALSGWQVVSEGAQLTDQLTDMVQEQLDRRRTENAGA